MMQKYATCSRSTWISPKSRRIGSTEITGPWPLQTIVQDVTGVCSPIVSMLKREKIIDLLNKQLFIMWDRNVWFWFDYIHDIFKLIYRIIFYIAWSPYMQLSQNVLQSRKLNTRTMSRNIGSVVLECNLLFAQNFCDHRNVDLLRLTSFQEALVKRYRVYHRYILGHLGNKVFTSWAYKLTALFNDEVY